MVDVEYTFPHKQQSDGSWYDYSKAKIRVETIELLNKLENAYSGMFVECRDLLLKDEFGI